MSTLQQTWALVLVAPSGPTQRRRRAKMGDGSAPFCRKAHDVRGQNATLMPGNLDLAEMGRDLDSRDGLNPCLLRLMRLMEKVRDMDMALGKRFDGQRSQGESGGEPGAA